jgi:hypothetical protein
MGRELKDNLSLFNYKIQDGSTVQAMVKPEPEPEVN